MAPTVEVRELSFRYPSYPSLESRRLLDGAGLTVEQGSCLRILGGPESGKSTLARILCGLVPRYSGGDIAGEVRVAGLDVRRVPPCDLIESVGLVFQNPDEQIVTTSCRAEVAFALESLGLPPEEIRARASEALEWAGLGQDAERSPLALSGGQKRRLLLACLHALRPAVWLLDETIEELDAQFRGVLVRLLRERGSTALLFASKDLPLPESALEATWRLQGGILRVEEAGACSEAAEAAEKPPTTAAAGPPVLSAHGIEYSYTGPQGGFRLSVRDFALREGEVVALVGANGAGKSTLARILCGLIRPTEGEVSVRATRASGSVGRGTGGSKPDELRRSVAYVYQNPDYQIYLPTVREELEYGLIEAGEDLGSRRKLVEEAISRFGLPGAEAPSALLSYGARKRLQMAVYYLLRRRVVILDEADAGITREDFRSAVRAFTDQGGSVLFVSHDAQLARSAAHRVLSMEQGVLAC